MKAVNRSLFLLGAIAILASVAVAQDEAQKITFKKRDPVVGDIQTRGSDMDMQTNISMKMGEMEQAMEQKVTTNQKRDTEILVVKDGKVKKIRISFREFEIAMSMNGQEFPTPMDLAGKSVIVEHTDAGVKVTAEDDAQIEQALLDGITKEEFNDAGEYVGWSPDFSKALPNRALTVGETISLDGKAAAAMLSGRGNDQLGDVQEMTLKLTGTKKFFGAECAVFDFKAKMGGSPEFGGMGGGGGPRMTVKSTMTGKMVVGVANSWLYELTMEGPVKFEGDMEADESPMEMSGEGKVAVKNMAVYQKKKA